MTATGNLVKVAKVLKSNGTDGELLVGFFALSPEDLNLSEPVFIEFDGLPVPFFVQSLRVRGRSKALVYLNDVVSRRDTEELAGRDIFLPSDEEDCYDEGDFSFLAGWELYDGKKPVGKIADFLDIPGNPCLEMSDGFLVPLHGDLILEVDEKRQIVRMGLPAGLFD